LEFGKLSNRDKLLTKKLSMRKIHPIFLQLKPGMVYIPTENLITDLNGMPLELIQHVSKGSGARNRINNLKVTSRVIKSRQEALNVARANAMKSNVTYLLQNEVRPDKFLARKRVKNLSDSDSEPEKKTGPLAPSPPKEKRPGFSKRQLGKLKPKRLDFSDDDLEVLVQTNNSPISEERDFAPSESEDDSDEKSVEDSQSMEIEGVGENENSKVNENSHSPQLEEIETSQVEQLVVSQKVQVSQVAQKNETPQVIELDEFNAEEDSELSQIMDNFEKTGAHRAIPSARICTQVNTVPSFIPYPFHLWMNLRHLKAPPKRVTSCLKSQIELFSKAKTSAFHCGDKRVFFDKFDNGPDSGVFQTYMQAIVYQSAGLFAGQCISFNIVEFQDFIKSSIELLHKGARMVVDLKKDEDLAVFNRDLAAMIEQRDRLAGQLNKPNSSVFAENIKREHDGFVAMIETQLKTKENIMSTFQKNVEMIDFNSKSCDLLNIAHFFVREK
jgi:hypothetical protein